VWLGAVGALKSRYSAILKAKKKKKIGPEISANQLIFNLLSLSNPFFRFSAQIVLKVTPTNISVVHGYDFNNQSDSITLFKKRVKHQPRSTLFNINRFRLQSL
jgi:hypothetical protein